MDAFKKTGEKDIIKDRRRERQKEITTEGEKDRRVMNRSTER
jgi:hypothetical protein